MAQTKYKQLFHAGGNDQPYWDMGWTAHGAITGNFKGLQHHVLQKKQVRGQYGMATAFYNKQFLYKIVCVN